MVARVVYCSRTWPGCGEDESSSHANCPAMSLGHAHQDEAPRWHPKCHRGATPLLRGVSYSNSHKGWNRLATALAVIVDRWHSQIDLPPEQDRIRGGVWDRLVSAIKVPLLSCPALLEHSPLPWDAARLKSRGVPYYFIPTDPPTVLDSEATVSFIIADGHLSLLTLRTSSCWQVTPYFL